MLNEILWKKLDKKLLIGAGLGTFAGLLLLLFALQTFLDFRSIINGDSSNAANFVLINKKVNLLNTLGAKSTFSETEITELADQPFVREIGKFTSNQFKVSASSSTLGFYTELFFEAVPDNFLDFDAKDFQWQKGQREIPIVMSRDYLALYNFGFAPSHGLPQFTQSTIRRVSFTITVSGNGISRQFKGRIVGFSDRINSIIVPQPFMDWANQQFSGSKNSATARLIIDCTNPASKEVTAYFNSNGYEVSRGKLIGEGIQVAVQIIFGIIAFLGVIILLLSLLVFLLNFQLIIASSKDSIILLLELGYHPAKIIKTLNRQVMIWLGAIFMVTLMAFLSGRYFLDSYMANQGFEYGFWPNPIVFFTIGLLTLIFVTINFMVIKNKIQSLAS
ncbi:MAG: hypothetical protein AAF502_01850 [Bacteroidota bacterium]